MLGAAAGEDQDSLPTKQELIDSACPASPPLPPPPAPPPPELDKEHLKPLTVVAESSLPPALIADMETDEQRAEPCTSRKRHVEGHPVPEAKRLRGKTKVQHLRKPRESYATWYARVETAVARDSGATPHSQGHYRNAWQALSDEERARWTQSHSFGVAPAVAEAAASLPNSSSNAAAVQADVEAAAAEDVAETIALPAGYSAQKLPQECKAISVTHSDRLANPEKRYHMYAKLALLLHGGVWPSLKACLDDPALQRLAVKRKKLQKVTSLLREGGSLLAECPASFRTGRAPAQQLSASEKDELLQYIKYHARYSMPLSVVQCKQLGRAEHLRV